MAKLTFRGFISLFKDAYDGWNEDNAWRLGAALSFFAIFSLAPILIIAIAIASLAFGPAAAQGQIVSQIQGIIGSGGAKAIQTMIANANQSHTDILATIFGSAMLILGSTGVFVQLRGSLNAIWNLRQKPQTTIKAYFLDRGVSFAMILGIGVLFLALMLISAAISAFRGIIDISMSGFGDILPVLDIVVSFIITSALFAAIFKYLPDAKVRWRDVWIGAILTSILFTIGKYLIGLYLGKSGVSSAFGAASSLVIVMLWVFYSSVIMLYGAEFIKYYAERFGVPIKPDQIVEKVIIKPTEA